MLESVAVSRPPQSWERWPLTLAIGAAFVVGYTLTSRGPTDGAVLETALDRAIPFVPASILVYSSVYGAALIPLFVVRCPRLMRRAALAYAIVLTLAFGTYLIFPVSGVALRPPPAAIPEGFFGWGLRTTYAIDPPNNLFPSLHLASAALSAAIAWYARRAYGLLTFLGMLAIGVSTWTVKQHFVADSVAALVCAGVGWAIALRGYDPRAVPDDERARGWGGPLGYLGLMAAFYAGAFVLWLATG